MRDLNREPGTGLGVKLSSCICNSSSVPGSYVRVLEGNSSGTGGHTCFLNLILCFQFFVPLTDTPDSMLCCAAQTPTTPSQALRPPRCQCSFENFCLPLPSQCWQTSTDKQHLPSTSPTTFPQDAREDPSSGDGYRSVWFCPHDKDTCFPSSLRGSELMWEIQFLWSFDISVSTNFDLWDEKKHLSTRLLGILEKSADLSYLD